MYKSYLKFKTNNTTYIVAGKDFLDACKRSSKVAPPEARKFVGSLMQTPANSEAGLRFFAGADVVINIEE